MTNAEHAGQRVFLQGKDFKARCWAESFAAPVIHFATIREMLAMLRETARGDVIVYRYQNNPPRLLAALAVTLAMALQIARARLSGQAIVWVCHNVDKETAPHFPFIGSMRRAMLFRSARIVFVLDRAFIPYCKRADAVPISFGVKREGETSPANRNAAIDLAKGVDRAILIAGQDGGKYKAFERIPEIHARFAALGLTAGFVVAGMAANRTFAAEIERNLLRIDEPNIRESDLGAHLDYIYRENADISMPYSIYAAATAGIPILTREDNILAEIVARERIGLTLDSLGEADTQEYDFAGFLDRHQWTSLSDQLRQQGILK